MTGLTTFLWRGAIVGLLLFLSILAAIGRRICPRPRLETEEGITVVLTGTFYNDNWIKTHLVPLAQSRIVSQVFMVATTPIPVIKGVTPVYPGKRSRRLLGATIARLWTFARTCKSTKANVVGGFHLLLNGLVAQLVGALQGKHSLYICGGGVREIEGGGYLTQNALFMKIGYESRLIERLLIRSACNIDFVITMGTSVRDFFVNQGARGTVEVIPGGFDGDEFSPPANTAEKEFDLVTVGRVSDVKRPDIFVDVVDRLNRKGVSAKAVLVGAGPLLAETRKHVTERSLEKQVVFAGWQTDVVPWLRRSRIFLLTSESEGLSQALIQAMLCGLPAIVSDVGDLSDIVVDGGNGYLVKELDAKAFVEKIGLLLDDPTLLAKMSRAARHDAMRLSIEGTSNEWTRLFTEIL